MKAQELRIGNCVYGVSDRIEQVIQLSETNVTTDIVKINAPMEIGLNDISPIPLTEEWLIKFGIELEFEELESGSKLLSWVKGAFNLEIDKDGKICFEVYSHYIEVKYVHQLQNLYFALTEEELIIK
jgi:hypothetical protein